MKGSQQREYQFVRTPEDDLFAVKLAHRDWFQVSTPQSVKLQWIEWLSQLDSGEPELTRLLTGSSSQFDRSAEPTPEGIWSGIVPKETTQDLRMECELLKTQVIEHQFEAIEAKRRAEQADERVDELLSQHGDFLDLVKRVEAANKSIQRGLDARRTGKPCLHDKSEGYVSRRLDDEHVAIEFETSDDRVVEQIHHRDQFVNGKLPQEGDRMEAHVLAWFYSPEPADASKYLTAEELEHGFPGFQKAIERRREEEQADRT